MRQLKITKSITNRESAALDKYLEEFGHEDLMYSLFERHLNLEQIKSVTPEDIFSSNETEYACISHAGKEYFIGVNAMGKILMQLRENNGLLTYSLPDNLHLFGVKFSEYVPIYS